jgi:hypothetical protein
MRAQNFGQILNTILPHLLQAFPKGELTRREQQNLKTLNTISKNKKISLLTIALILTMTASAILTIPTASAHTPTWQIPTFAFMSVTPNPVGVNQRIDVVMWLSNVIPTASGAFGDRWQGFRITITKPDGTTATLGPFTSDPISSAYTSYTPDQTGTYKFVFSYPGQVLTGLPTQNGRPPTNAYVNDSYLASQSDPVYLTVQQQQIIPYQETFDPVSYWTRPVYGANRNWYSVASSWLGSAAQRNGPTTNFAWGKGPGSAHILWTLPYYSGGLMDARYGSQDYYSGYSYETYWSSGSTIIINGKLYFNDQTNPRMGWTCVDLRKGTIDYFQNTTGPISSAGQSFSGTGAIQRQALSFGEIFNYDSPNQHGGFAYLWSTSGYQGTGTWDMFDQFTGNYICSIANVTQSVRNAVNASVTVGATGTQVVGSDGSMCYYSLVNWGSTAAPQYRLLVWNNTQAIYWKGNMTQFRNGDYSSFSGNEYWFWRPNFNQTFDGTNGFVINVTAPNILNAGSIIQVREGQYIIGGLAGKNNGSYVQPGQLWAVSLKPGQEGTLLWNITFTPPQPNYTDQYSTTVSAAYPYGMLKGPIVDPEDGVFVFSLDMTRQWWGYSLATGKLLWGPTASEPQWNFYGMSYNIYQGKLLSTGYSGILYAYDIKTGVPVWNWSSGNVGFENYYSGNAPLSFAAICDGKIYLYSSEHSVNTPIRRDAFLWCVNATDGKLIWKSQCWAAGLAIGDGYGITLDSNDNQIYCYGPGPSQTTVSTQTTPAAQGSAVVIQGKVTDQSPGAKDTPAIADADQEAWMAYIYQQRIPMPTNVKGVKVHVTATDPNGNSQDIGYATSDVGGTFGITWTPPVQGTYKIMASFEGSLSYGPSYATTVLAVGPSSSPVAAIVTPAPTETAVPTAPAPTPVQTPTAAVTPSPVVVPPDNAGPTTTYLAIGAAVIVVIAAAAALILRKRK